MATRAPHLLAIDGPMLMRCVSLGGTLFHCASSPPPANECVGPLVDPLDAPVDDEPETAEDAVRMKETLDHIACGTTLTTEELLRRLRL